MIFVNFKTYKQGTGENALSLVKILEEVADKTQIKIIPVVQAADIKEIVSQTKLEVWAQKVDAFYFGAHTGAILPEAVVEDGGTGTFINHSEAKISDFDELEKVVKRSSEVGLKSLVFASDLKELERVVGLLPTFVAYEPPELIGSKDTSVTRERPEIISKAVEIAKAAKVPLIVGAGIKTSEDVKKSLELGAVGVAVSSDVVVSENPKSELLNLTLGFD
jgi:triosephosphate isomerase